MKKSRCFNRIYLLFLMVLGVMVCDPMPALADSRAATVRVSCTVVPMIEMVQNTTLTARSNLGDQYLSNETWVDRSGQQVKLVSITAL